YLEHDREAVLRQTRDIVETLDHVDLPERVVVIEGTRVQACRLDAELTPVTRLRQRDVADVEFEIEVGILDPVRVVEIERHVREPLPEAPHEMEPPLEVGQNSLEGDPAPWGGRLVVDQDASDVHRSVRGFEV